MQRINFHRPVIVEASELTFSRFVVVAVGAIAIALLLLAVNLIERAMLKEQLALVETERAAIEAQYFQLRDRALPAADPALTAELARMEMRLDYWLSVLALLQNSDTVSMARLDDALIAFDRADTDSVWLEHVSINYRTNPIGRIKGRAIHSDASAVYLRRLEEQIKTAGLTVSEMLVTANEAEPMTFQATLNKVGAKP